jgi:molybdopterin-guanine dinucleotide biosynthesis protein A
LSPRLEAVDRKIRRKDMILIGAAARKTGKTAFAGRVIAQAARRVEVIGLKITPVHDEELAPPGVYPWGDDDFPACGFRIREETAPSSASDTGRMLAAGARRAFWLEARREHVGVGVEALLTLVPNRAGLVAEGNSARRAVEPGLFILLKNPGETEEKNSFKELLPLADRVALFDGRAWDLPPEDCLFIDGEWMLKPPASAVVLTGGDSRRMGLDKSLLPIAGKPMIAHIVDRLRDLFDDIVIGGGSPSDYDFLGLEVVPDLAPGQGPLMGIASALLRTKNDLSFVIACDIPDFELGFISRMASKAEGYDLVLPVDSRGEFEPVFAYYRRSVAETARAVLAEGGRSILDLLPRVRWRSIPLPAGTKIRNIKTVDDYERLMNRE